jgi:CelD/BcsL family acetyltransferase involved in cellulose biosynthesis
MDIPGNEWTSAGQLLLDPDCHVPRVCGLLAAEMAELPCAAYWFASVPVDAPYWRALVDALGGVGLKAAVQPRYQVGRLVVAPACDRQPVHASRQFRRRMDRAVRDLERTGTLRLRRESPRDAKHARELLAQGLQLEHAGWKGRQKTSVLTCSDTTEFYLQQAEYLARWSQLEFIILEHNGRAIAFEYGWHAKQVYHSFKVAYDEQYRRHSPGQLLLWMLLKEPDQNMLPRAIDFLGPLDDAVRRWHPDCYRVGRILVPHRGLVGKTIAWASGMWLPDPVPLSPTVDVER